MNLQRGILRVKESPVVLPIDAVDCGFSPLETAIMSAPSPSRVASMFLLAKGGIEMDIYARARTLESAVGLPKWSLSRNPRAFLSEGPMVAGLENVDPEWFSTRDTGFAESVYRGAYLILKAETGAETAEEVAQNMVSGLATGGGVKEDVYGYLGKKNAVPILTGRKAPKALKTTLFGMAKDRATDIFRRKRTEKRRREKMHPSVVDSNAVRGVPSSDVAIDRSPNEVVLSLISGPAGRPFRNWIDGVIRQKSPETQVIIYDALMDHLSRTGKWPTAQQIRDRVIEVRGADISITKINQYRRKIDELIARSMKHNPKILDWVDRYLDLAQLGYGGGQLRAARDALLVSRASRVADRYLGTPYWCLERPEWLTGTWDSYEPS